MLAIYNYEGLGGLAKDEAEGVKLVKIAAEKVSAVAEHFGGSAYLRGRSVLANDEAEAAKHLKIAADKGLATSQNVLGVLYMNGQGGSQ